MKYSFPSHIIQYGTKAAVQNKDVSKAHDLLAQRREIQFLSLALHNSASSLIRGYVRVFGKVRRKGNPSWRPAVLQ